MKLELINSCAISFSHSTGFRFDVSQHVSIDNLSGWDAGASSRSMHILRSMLWSCRCGERFEYDRGRRTRDGFKFTRCDVSRILRGDQVDEVEFTRQFYETLLAGKVTMRFSTHACRLLMVHRVQARLG